MTRDEILALLENSGSLLEGHYGYASGLHSEILIRPAKTLQFPPYSRALCYEIVRHFLELDIHVVLGASVSSIPAAVEVGRQLEARTLFVDESKNPLVLEHGFELHDGERALIVHDLLATNDNTNRISSMIRAAKARLVGVGSIVDMRTSGKIITAKDVAAIQCPQIMFDPKNCPQCAAGIPLIALPPL